MINFSVDYAGLYISWAKTSSSYHGCKGDTIKLILHYNDRYYLQNCKAITFEKIANHTKYEKPNVPSHLHIFWLNFNKANYSFLHLFLLFGKQIFERMVPGAMSISFCLERDDKNLGTSFEWGGAWVQMPQVNTFSRNVNPINFSHILWNVEVWVKIHHTSILERDKALESTWKYEKMYSWSQSHGGNWDCLPFCWF